ncbi:MAG: hypothetical protein ACPGTU_04225 [Myxococcota bacterium]
MSRLVWIVVIATACSGSDETSQGTVVGNPGDTSMQLARSAGAEVVDAYTVIDALEWVDCNGDDFAVDVQSEINLLDGDPIESPHGEWCALTIQLGDALLIEAEVVQGDDDEMLWVQLDLEVESIRLDARDGFVIDGDSTVVELGEADWLELNERDLDEGDERIDECDDVEERLEELLEACEDGDEEACEELDDVTDWYEENCTEDDEEDDERRILIDSDSSAHDAFARQFALGSALYEDSNGDGWLSDDERTAGSVAAGTEHTDSVDEESSADDAASDTEMRFDTEGDIEVGGCGRSESNLAWFLLPLFVFPLRRPRA